MSLTLILGPMYSGKSSSLIRMAERYRIADKRVLVIKYIGDNRYSDTEVASHSGAKLRADLSVNTLGDIDVTDYDVICIDEIQFYLDNHQCIAWADYGKTVIASGLSGNFLRKLFKGMDDLIANADSIIHLNSICMMCKNENGSFSHLLKSKTAQAAQAETELIGGTDTFIALCRSCYVLSNKV
jgi:thymidine kinase